MNIPKEQGKTRPIGISAFEDQRVQDAVREVLEAIYEQDFLDCSYGFRPGRSAHDAVRTLDQIVHRGEGSWILEADIVSFFDSIDRNERRKMLEIRVADGSLLRLIGKCLQVGGLDGAELSAPETGTAQGSVLSPLLGNITLHYALDLWLKWPRRRLVSAACCSLTGRCRWRWHPSVTDWIARRRLARRVLHAIPQQPRRERAQ